MKKLFAFAIALIFSVSASTALANPQQGGLISGKVVETMNSGGYTYVCVEKSGKKTWVAVPQMQAKKGDTMSFRSGMEMKNFESKTLKRTFPSIVFSDGPADAQPGAAHAPQTTAAKEKVSVEKAAGKNAYTIAELFAKKKELNKKPVVVRAKVVKVTSGIMGKNWIHLQDGTGSDKQGDHDITATTGGAPAMGDVVTVSGTLAVDKDFGMGYRYAIIIENAAVKK